MKKLPLFAIVLVGLVGLVSMKLLADSSGQAVYVIIQNGYNPTSVTIKTGQTVIWNNMDDRDHDVTAVDGSFRSGNLKNGQSYQHVFTTVGQFPYACSLHPRERGMVIVTNGK